MKRLTFLGLLVGTVCHGQIYSRSSYGGAITITPGGLYGKTMSPSENSNVALGPLALSVNQTGSNNTAIGSEALFINTNSGNTALGYYSLRNNSTGSGNTAVGANSLSSNTLGGSNTADGYEVLKNNTEGYQNTASGKSALFSNTTGYNNTAIGYGSLFSNKVGSGNTALGYRAGSLIGVYSPVVTFAGGNNIFIGSNANPLVADIFNATALGADASVDASNKVRIGNDAVTVIEGQVAWSYPSDRRLKENIKYTSSLGLNFISKLQSVSYNYISDKTKVRHDGFVAQDIEAVMKELNVPFSGLKKADDGTYSLAYSDFVMPLVNAVKELKQQNEEQQTEIDALKKKLSRMEELEKRILTLEANAVTIPTSK